MRFKKFFVWGMFLLFATSAYAQLEQGRLIGQVADLSGAVIPNAAITITNMKTGEVRKLTSSESGEYIAANLAPATYTVVGEATGLSRTEFKDVPLAAGQVRTLNIILQPESVASEVTVVGGDLAVIDTSSARVGANINEREVAALPLNGRQLSQLYLLAPGAQTAGGGSYDNIRFSGRANQQNAIRYDGVEGSAIIDASPGNLNGESSSGFRLQSSLENVQEFRVESSNYPAEYGTGTGGQITVVTKSGGNEFHGSLFHYLRNNAMDARNFFDQQKSPLRLNQFGASFGGPIVKNKLFFFGTYEGLRQRAGVNYIETVPSASAKARAVPSIRPLLDAFPSGTPTSNPDLELAQLNASNQVDENYGSLRVDYHINDKYTVYARYFRDQGTSVAPLGVTGNTSQIRAVPQNALVNFQQVLSPTVINETKIGYNGYLTRINGVAPMVNGIDMSSILLSYTGSVALPGIGGQGASAGAAVPGGLLRSNSTQNGRGQPYTNYTLTVADNLTWIKSNHNFKFGFEYRPIRMYTDRQGGTTYTFSNVNDLVNNNPSQVQFLGDVSSPSPFNNGATGNRLAKQHYLVGYAQDEWKLRHNLTMSYGLRYEFYSVMKEDQNRAVIFNTETGNLMPSNTPFYKSSKLNFGPRLAFSWAPDRFKNNTVFRIGAGYYYGPGQTEDLIQPIESDRVSRTLTNVVYPIIPANIIANYNINDPNLGFQPRAYAPGYRVPERILSYTVSMQQKLFGDGVLTVAYVGSQGRNLFLRSWSNLQVGVNTDPVTGLGKSVLQFGNRFAQVDYKTSGGTDHYDSLQTTYQRRYAKGLTVGAQWTYGHSIGNTGGSNEAQTAANPYDFSVDRGNNAFDVRHSGNVSALYEMPFGKGRKYGSSWSGFSEAFLGGWQLGGIWNGRTGLPVDVKITRPDFVYRDNRNGNIVNSPILVNGSPVTTAIENTPGGGAFRNARRPDYIGGDVFIKTDDRRYMLNPAAFAIPQPGMVGNLGRWAIHGPAMSQFDLTLHKRFSFTERTNLEFRSEIYNLFNLVNFANPPATLANALGTGTNQLQPGQAFTRAAAGGNFGVANGTVERAIGLGTSRQIQFSLRFNF